MNVLTNIFGMVLISKLYFVLTLALAGWLGRAWVRFFDTSSPIVEGLAMVFFMMQPWIYERMMTQPTIAMGMVLVGWGMYWIAVAMIRPQASYRAFIFSGIAMGCALANMSHATYMIVLIYGMFCLFFARSWRDARGVFIAGSIILMANLNWMLAPLWGVGNAATSIDAFTETNVTAFLTRATPPLSTTVSNILLYGFWGEMKHFARPDAISPYWYLAGFGIIGISLWGIILLMRRSWKLGAGLSIIGLFSLILGLGVATAWTRPIMEWCYAHLPLFMGYREPQKWIGLLGWVWGIGWIMALLWCSRSAWGQRFFQYGGIGLLVCLLALWSPGMPLGFHGQLTTMRYPPELMEAKNTLQADNPGKVLVLPWHSYMACSWTNKRIIANLMQIYMAPLRTTTADNIEMTTLYTNSTNPESQMIEKFLAPPHTPDAFLEAGYTHILVLNNCANHDGFPWLAEVSECAQSATNDIYTIWRCGK